MDAIEPIKDTNISEETLIKIVNAITTEPEDFHIHPKLKKFLENQKKIN